MSKPKSAEAWLRQRVRAGSLKYAAGSVGVMLLAAVALIVTWWFLQFYAIGIIARLLGIPPAWQFVIGLVVLALLFAAGVLSDRRELETLSFSTGTFEKRPVTIYVPGVGFSSTINPFAPDSARSFIKILAMIVCFGPRLAVESVRLLGKALRLRGVDVEGCAPVLAVLAKADGRVPFPDLAAAVPAGHDVGRVLSQVQELDGVLLLRAEPPGLSLMSEVRAQLRKAMLKGKPKKADPA